MNYSIIFEKDLESLISEIYLIGGIVMLLMYGVFVSSKYPITGNVLWLSVLLLNFTIYLTWNTPLMDRYVLNNSLILDGLSQGLKLLILISTTLSILISLDYIRKELMNHYETIILILIASLSMILMVSCNDMISMYLTIELQTLCFYVLAASKSRELFSTEAGLKYFVLGSISSGLLLFGSSLIYGVTGVIEFSDLMKLMSLIEGNWSDNSLFVLGLVFFSSGLLFKLSAAPFHMWTPDVYEGSPTNITAYFSIAPKLAVLGLMFRIYNQSLSFSWHEILLISSILSMILGGLGALGQQKIKRLLAYSSIGHVGYMLIGLICSTSDSISATLFYITLYIIIIINIFSVIMSLRKGKYQYRTLNDLSLLSIKNPILGLSLTLSFFSLAGIPPLSGFLSKFWIFLGAIESKEYVIVTVGVIMSCISCYYSLKIIKEIYFTKSEKWLSLDAVGRENSLIISLSLLFIMLIWLYPSIIIQLTNSISLLLTSPPIN